MIAASTHFGKSSRERLLEWQRHQQQLDHARQHEKRKTQETEESAEADLVAAVMTVASSEQVESFSIHLDQFDEKLDQYHEASLEALMEAHAELEDVKNQLKNVRHELDIMRMQAFELEDGTRIFVSEDEQRAIDMDGNEIDIDRAPLDAVPPAAKIADRYVEQFNREKLLAEQETKLEKRIDNIHAFDEKRAEFSERSEDMHEQIEGGDISEQELNALEEELEAMDSELNDLMPPSMRATINGVTSEAKIPKVKTDFGVRAAGFQEKPITTPQVTQTPEGWQP